MSKQKVACAKFIVAAIREMRQGHSSDMEEGVSCGIQLRKVFLIAMTVYSPREFSNGLRNLIKQNEVLMTARIWEYEKGEKNKDSRHSSDTHEKIEKLPDPSNFSDKNWTLDLNGKRVDENTPEAYRFFRDIMLHVIADGLPRSLKKFVGGNKDHNVLVEKIMNRARTGS